MKRLTRTRFLFLAAVLSATMPLLTGCTGSEQADAQTDIPSETMLIDCYRRTTAATDSNGYYEAVLYTTEDSNKLKLCVYSKEDNCTEEICTEYIVPYEAAGRCYELIEKHRLGSWNDMADAQSADGQLTVCRYYDNGSYIRVSTEHMPPDGEEILCSIENVLSEYIRRDYRTDN